MRYNCKFPPPVLINAKLYVLTEPPENRQAAVKIIVKDVDSETHWMYHLPKEFKGVVMETMHAFEMNEHDMKQGDCSAYTVDNLLLLKDR